LDGRSFIDKNRGILSRQQLPAFRLFGLAGDDGYHEDKSEFFFYFKA